MYDNIYLLTFYNNHLDNILNSEEVNSNAETVKVSVTERYIPLFHNIFEMDVGLEIHSCPGIPKPNNCQFSCFLDWHCIEMMKDCLGQCQHKLL